eukprot:364088-Chlamydomonas_euryale.AAC.3
MQSFSFTMGTTPYASSSVKVLRTLRYCPRTDTFSSVTSTCGAARVGCVASDLNLIPAGSGFWSRRLAVPRHQHMHRGGTLF